MHATIRVVRLSPAATLAQTPRVARPSPPATALRSCTRCAVTASAVKCPDACPHLQKFGANPRNLGWRGGCNARGHDGENQHRTDRAPDLIIFLFGCSRADATTRRYGASAFGPGQRCCRAACNYGRAAERQRAREPECAPVAERRARPNPRRSARASGARCELRHQRRAGTSSAALP